MQPPNITSILNPEQDMARENMAQNTPLPAEQGDDDLLCDGLHCVEVDPESVEMNSDQAWHCSFYVTEQDVETWRHEIKP